jgi:hypothetical protein
MADNPYNYLADDIEDAPGFGTNAPTDVWDNSSWEPPELQMPDLTRSPLEQPTGFGQGDAWTRKSYDSQGKESVASGYGSWLPTAGDYNSPAFGIGVPIWGSPTNAKGTNAGVSDPLTPNMYDYWTDETRTKAVGNWLNTMLPLSQYQQNAYQYERDAGEANRRWDAETQWQNQLENYNAQLATRQQQMEEWMAGEQLGQWEEQFEWQKQGDLIAQDIATREIALTEERVGRELTLSEKAQAWQEAYQQAQLDIQREQMENELLAARYAAFGRAQAPGIVANWG